MKEDRELECPWNEKILCIDAKCFHQKQATKAELSRRCNKCAWGPNGESIMTAQLNKAGYINVDGKWKKKPDEANG